jgi:hypothetical protein
MCRLHANTNTILYEGVEHPSILEPLWETEGVVAGINALQMLRNDMQCDKKEL